MRKGVDLWLHFGPQGSKRRFVFRSFGEVESETPSHLAQCMAAHSGSARNPGAIGAKATLSQGHGPLAKRSVYQSPEERKTTHFSGGLTMDFLGDGDTKGNQSATRLEMTWALGERHQLHESSCLIAASRSKSDPIWLWLKISQGQTAGILVHVSAQGNPFWNSGFLNSPQPYGG